MYYYNNFQDSAIGYEMPESTFSYKGRDTILYALGGE